MQQFLKPVAGTAWTWVVAAELLDQFLVPVHDAVAALDAGFGREAFPALTRGLETRTGRGVLAWFS
jgi:hypothetical protein